ncbi:Fe-S protein assembly co-chaperone HscB [Shigella flexneri]
MPAVPRRNNLPRFSTSATINQAWQTLRHPLMRAEYLLSLHGFDIRSEQHHGARYRVPDGTTGAAGRAGRD